MVDQELLEHMIATTDPLSRNWFFSMMDVLPHQQLTLMIVTLWAVWTAKRKLIHEYPTHLFVSSFIAELDQVNTQPSPGLGGKQAAGEMETTSGGLC